MGSGADGMNEASITEKLTDPLARAALKLLSLAHWQYIESVLKQHGESEDVIAKCGHHYLAAFEHGWKHAKDEA